MQFMKSTITNLKTIGGVKKYLVGKRVSSNDSSPSPGQPKIVNRTLPQSKPGTNLESRMSKTEEQDTQNI
jgi:hypothetical protein